MSTLFARQLIFTNVEASQSPKGVGGFQVLFASAGVSEVDRQEAPERLFYREIKKDEELPIKHVFYPTRSGEFLVARFVPLPDPDGAGRYGRYLAHALIFSPPEFAVLGNDPFAVFKGFGFVDTVDAALDLGDGKIGDIPYAEIRLGEEQDATTARAKRIDRVQSLNALLMQSKRDLLLLATIRASEEDARNSIGLFGEPDIVFNYLSSLVAAMPIPLRAKCSFDTFFRGGNLNSLSYWAVGLPANTPRSSRLFCFDCVQGRFEHPVSPEPQTLYEQWLDEQWVGEEERALAEVARLADAAWSYSHWLDSPTFPAPSPRNQEETKVWVSLSRRRPDALQNQIRRQLERQAGENLGRALALELRSRGENQENQGAIGGEFSLQQLADLTWNLCLRQGVSLEPAIWKDVAEIAESSGRALLKLAVLRASRQWERLTQALQLVGDEDFKEFSLWVLAPLSPRVTWSVQRDGPNLTFGPRLNFDSGGGETDSIPLMCALLGRSPSSSDDGQVSLRDRLSFIGAARRAENVKFSQGATSVNTRRWLWLLQEIERDSSTYSSSLTAAKDRSARPENEKPQQGIKSFAADPVRSGDFR